MGRCRRAAAASAAEVGDVGEVGEVGDCCGCCASDPPAAAVGFVSSVGDAIVGVVVLDWGEKLPVPLVHVVLRV
jgi:hypothetical protein